MMDASALPTAPLRRVGDVLYLSGHIGDRDGALSKDFSTQVRQAFENIKTTLAAEGAQLRDVVAVTCYVADFAYFTEFNEIWKQTFSETPPTRATLKVGFASDEILIEMVAIAHVPRLS